MKKNIYKIVGLLLLLPLFSGCNDSDDVAAIFTGKTWKLNYITVDGGHEMFGFWENEEQEKASIKELNKNGTYNIVFDGTVDGDGQCLLGNPPFSQLLDVTNMLAFCRHVHTGKVFCQ